MIRQILLLAFCHLCLPCKVLNWRRKTISEQAGEAEVVVYGMVRAHYPMTDAEVPDDQDIPIENAYIAEMDVICNLKGEVLPPRINISEAGELTSCHHTRLPVNGIFITFLKRSTRTGQLVPDEVNYLSVAFPPTSENVEGVENAVGDLEVKCPQLESLVINAANANSGSMICFVAMVIFALIN